MVKAMKRSVADAAAGPVEDGKGTKRQRKTCDARQGAEAPVKAAETSTKFVAQRAERGKGLKFKMETYQTVSNFSPGTMIKYCPNPKHPSSKSFVRYAKYENAKTVGESLKAGSKVADLLWELERGIYKVLGGVRSEEEEIKAIGRAAYKKAQEQLSAFNGPRGLPVNFNDERATEALKKEEAWREEKLKRCEKLAKQLGLTPETPEQIDQMGINESSEIRLQRRVADALSETMLKAGRKLTDADMTEVLECWGFCENDGRVNVLPEGQTYVYSDTIGAIRRRTGEFGITPPTRRYPNFVKFLCRWLQDNKPKIKGKTFKCCAINLNCNYAAKRHRDQNNEGPSVIKAFGPFTGGRLHYWENDRKKPRPKVETLPAEDAKVLDIKKTTAVFDGNRAHSVEDFTGNRYSAVFFTSGGYHKAPSEISGFLESLGFPWPSEEDIKILNKAIA